MLGNLLMGSLPNGYLPPPPPPPNTYTYKLCFSRVSLLLLFVAVGGGGFNYTCVLFSLLSTFLLFTLNFQNCSFSRFFARLNKGRLLFVNYLFLLCNFIHVLEREREKEKKKRHFYVDRQIGRRTDRTDRQTKKVRVERHLYVDCS